MDAESKEFWDGVAVGELRIQRCETCGHAVFYPRALCPFCHSERLVWIAASGTGEVYSYTVAHRAFGEFAEQTPFTVALVDLDEGVRMLTRIIGDGVGGDTVAIGDRVELEITAIGDHELPCFRPVA